MRNASTMRAKLMIAAAIAVVAASGGWYAFVRSDPGPDMVAAGQDFLGSLSADQRAKATMAFDDPARLDWHFIPKPERKGLQIKYMNDAQRKAAHKLLTTGLSHLGYDKATTIMGLEAILHELEKSRTDAPIRDPERYYFTVFGTPDAAGRWGWSVEGHHLSLNFVVDRGHVSATTPTFFGANPAEVKSDFGTFKQGLRILKPEEDTGFKLLAALTPEQRKKATIAEKAPSDLRGAAPAAAAQGIARRNLGRGTDAATNRVAAGTHQSVHRQYAAVGRSGTDAKRSSRPASTRSSSPGPARTIPAWAIIMSCRARRSSSSSSTPSPIRPAIRPIISTRCGGI